MFDFLIRDPDRKRRRLLRRVPTGPLRDYLSIPLADPLTRISDTQFLAVDFETTGFDPVKDDILSIGFVKIDGLAISLRSASHDVIRVKTDLNASGVVIHKITDTEKNQGVPAEAAIRHLLENLQGRVLLAHFTRTELGFLEATCKKLYGHAPPVRSIDTLQLAARLFRQSPEKLTRHHLRLFNLRKYYKLPEYEAHNAFLDALSAAELFLAQVNRLPDGPKAVWSKLY